MDADAKQLAALEDELRKDLEAIARVRQLMAEKSSPDSRQYSLPIPITDASTKRDSNDDDGPVHSLRGTIEQIINSDPEARWTTQKVLARLVQDRFPLKAKKPIYSVGQALQNLADKGSIRLVRRGEGSAPNIYRAKSAEQPAEAHSGGEAKQSLVG